MPRKSLPRIAAIAPGRRPRSLLIHWQDGGTDDVDVAGLIATFRIFEALRSSPDMFNRVTLGEHGTDVTWPDGTDISADTLWRLSREQSGSTIDAAAFRAWRTRKAYTQEDAARALGISRRIICYYEDGTRPIPRTVALATRALELEPA